MSIKARNKATEAENRRGRLFLYSLAQIEDYHPVNDEKIRKLLVAVKRKSTKCSQGFVDRLAFFWRMKITYHLDELWRSVRLNDFPETKRTELLETAKSIGGLIDFAVGEFKELVCYPNAEKLFSDQALRLYQQSLVSFLENPLLGNSARVIDATLTEELWQLTTIDISEAEQLEPEAVAIKPLRELDKDDLMGQMMRCEGLIDARPAGRIIVAGWNLPVTETEEGEFSVHIGTMLIEFGGCPLGMVYDSSERRHPEGYNPNEKSCCYCGRREYCPGTNDLKAWTLGHLALKLRYAWMHRHNILEVVPGFAPKMLTCKK